MHHIVDAITVFVICPKVEVLAADAAISMMKWGIFINFFSST
jgi:hypothetical protein